MPSAATASRSRRPSPGPRPSSTSWPRPPASLRAERARPPARPPEVVDRQHLRRPGRCRASSGGSGRASRSGAGSPSSAARTWPTVDQVQEFYDACPAAADRLRGDRPARGPRRSRDDLPRPPRRPPAGPPDLGHRAAAARVSTATGKAALASLDDAELDGAGSRAITTLPRPTPKSHGSVDALLADLAEVRDRGYAIDDEETVEGVVCYGIVVPARQPGDGPYAASITLLKVRATDERVPAPDRRPALARRTSFRPAPGVDAAEPVDVRPRSRRRPRRAPSPDSPVRQRRARSATTILVRGGQEADRPVRAEEEPVAARSARAPTSTDGREVVDRPRVPVGLGHEAGELAPHVRQAAERPASSVAHGSSVAARRSAAWRGGRRRTARPGSARASSPAPPASRGAGPGGRRRGRRARRPRCRGGRPAGRASRDRARRGPGGGSRRAGRHPGPARSSASDVADARIRQVDPADDAGDERRRGRESRGSRASRPGSVRVWTTIVPSTPAAASSGAQVVGGERAADRGELVGQPRDTVARSGSQKCWCASTDGRGHPCGQPASARRAG